MSFLSMAKRVNTLLNKWQKERVLQEVEEIVRREINKVLDAEEVCSAATTAAPQNMPPPPPITPMPVTSTSTSDMQNFIGPQAPPPLLSNAWTSTTIKAKSPLIRKLVSNCIGCRCKYKVFFIVQIVIMGN